MPARLGASATPAINAAFERCSKNAKVVLDKYYVVDTLLLTKDLDDVEIELSGTGERLCGRLRRPVCDGITSSVQYTPDIAKWSPQSLYLVYQNAYVRHLRPVHLRL